MLKKAKVIYYLNDKSTFNQASLIEHIKKSDIKFISKEEEAISHIVSFLPPGTVFAQSYGIEEKNNVICLPLLSSHLSLPLKQGEYVWYVSDDDSKKERKNSQEIFKNHPLLSINDYWVSRIHGSLISEDLNYSFKERDSLLLDKKVTKDNLEEKNKDSAILPSFDNKNVFISDEDNEQIKSTKDLYEEGIGNYFGDKAVPRMFSKSDDFTLQGSYNTLINFTSSDASSSQKDSREGLIDIAVGRLALQDFTLQDDVVVKFKKLITNAINTENIQKDQELSLSLEKYLLVDNTSGGEELFKKPNLYLNEDIDTFNSVEDKVDYESDASRILISESIDFDNDEYYDTSFISVAEYFSDDFEKVKTELNKDYLNNTKLSLDNVESDLIEVASINNKDELIAVPSILLKTNNIRIISRKELSNKETSIPSGNIRLIKEDKSFINYAQLLLESDGDVFVDGKSIKIGDFRKEVMKFNNISTLEELDNVSIKYDNDKIKTMHGKGFGVLLGYDENISESLVLGETLVAILSEIINATNSSLNKISSHAKDIEDSINIDNSKLNAWIALVGSALAIPMSSPLKQNYDTEKLKNTLIKNEIKNLKNIKNNLVDILSRFSKTS
jgi:hypothetical protein